MSSGGLKSTSHSASGPRVCVDEARARCQEAHTRTGLRKPPVLRCRVRSAFEEDGSGVRGAGGQRPLITFYFGARIQSMRSSGAFFGEALTQFAASFTFPLPV